MFGSRSRTCSESSDADQTQGRPISPGTSGSSPPSLLSSSPPSLLTSSPPSLLTSSPPSLLSSSVGYDLEGKFTFSQVMKQNLGKKLKTTVDENGKFNYVSADMRPVPPGWYDMDKSKHKVPIGWYDQNQAKKQ